MVTVESTEEHMHLYMPIHLHKLQDVIQELVIINNQDFLNLNRKIPK